MNWIVRIDREQREIRDSRTRKSGVFVALNSKTVLNRILIDRDSAGCVRPETISVAINPCNPIHPSKWRDVNEV
jgi:hypothetical protein